MYLHCQFLISRSKCQILQFLNNRNLPFFNDYSKQLGFHNLFSNSPQSNMHLLGWGCRSPPPGEEVQPLTKCIPGLPWARVRKIPAEAKRKRWVCLVPAEPKRERSSDQKVSTVRALNAHQDVQPLPCGPRPAHVQMQVPPPATEAGHS